MNPRTVADFAIFGFDRSGPLCSTFEASRRGFGGTKSGHLDDGQRVASSLANRIAARTGVFRAWSWRGLVVVRTKFSATAYLRVDADNRPLIFKTADEAASRGSDFKLYKNTQQQMLLTPFVLNAALRDPQVSGLPEITQQPDAIAWLQKNLQIKFPADGEIMHVSFESVSPSACVEIVNGVVKCVHERSGSRGTEPKAKPAE